MQASKNIGPNSGLMTVLSLIAFAISTASTGNGIYNWISSVVDAPKPLLFGVSLGFSGLLTLMAFMLWRGLARLMRERNLGTALMALMGGVLVSSMSIAFSAAGIVFFLKAKEIDAYVRDNSVRSLIAPIENFSSGLSAVSAMSAQVATASTNAALLENQKGSSCGYFTSVGDGPIHRMRNSIAADAADMKLIAASLSAKANALVPASAHAYTQVELDALFLKARTLFTDPEVMKLQLWAQSNAAAFKAKEIPFEGVLRPCVDPQLEAAFSKLDQSMASLGALPQTAPIIPRPDFALVMALSYANIIGNGADDFPVSPIFFLIVALVIDMCGIVPAFLAGRAQPELDDAERQVLDRMRWLLQALLIVEGKEEIFVVPWRGGHPGIMIQARNIVDRFDLSLQHAAADIPAKLINGVSKDALAGIINASGNATHFTFYKYNDALRAERKRIENILQLSHARYSYDQPPSVPVKPLLRAVS